MKEDPKRVIEEVDLAIEMGSTVREIEKGKEIEIGKETEITKATEADVEIVGRERILVREIDTTGIAREEIAEVGNMRTREATKITHVLIRMVMKISLN